jgi:hypothetical protein
MNTTTNLIEVTRQAIEYLKENNINKPHFIKHATEVLAKAEKENSPMAKAIELASHYLSDGDISTEEMIEAIANHEDQSDMIDNVEGVVVWEKVEWSFTCEQFLEEIGY